VALGLDPVRLSKIKEKVEAYMAELKIPGLVVAIAKKGNKKSIWSVTPSP